MNFTADQLQAIEHPSTNLQLIACAGSGKTEVVARRVAHLLKTGWDEGLRPRSIIAFTFTDKAAAELKERIAARCKDALGDIPGMAEMYVGTIHAFCLDLLKGEVPRYAKFEILNEIQRGLLIDRESRRTGLTRCSDLKGNPLKRYVDTHLYARALDLLREADVDPAIMKTCAAWDLLEDYRTLLESKGYFDYTSILVAAVETLLNDEGVRQRLAERVRHVIVDEYQDVNPIQEQIVVALHELGARICVVGDDDQTVYQWRGSDVTNILKFASRYPDVTQIRLQENHRSSRGVVELARDFIARNTERLEKAMVPTDAQMYESGDIVARTFDSLKEEARFVTDTMRSLHGVGIRDGMGERGISWSDMAVLLRSVKGSGEPILEALKAAEIPFIIVGMNNLFEQPEAEAARQLFYFMANRTDAQSLAQTWRDADLGIDEDRLQSAIDQSAHDRKGVTDPGDTRWNVYSLQRQYWSFLENAGVREERVPGSRGEVVFYNLGRFSQLISDFETIHFKSKPIDKYTVFADFLRYRVEDAYAEGWQDSQYASPDAVRIMTVHQSKGLQWPVVFLPQLVRNRFPSAAVGGRSVWHVVPEDGINGANRYKGTVEDERRLFYVALTRSQKFLIMTWAPTDGKGNRYKKPSEFFENMQESKFVKRFPAEYAARSRLPVSARAGIANVTLTFSELKYFFECPYQFKLRILYGFNIPLHEALGYGKSLHDALSEVHARAVHGEPIREQDAVGLVHTHLRTPYAYDALEQKLRSSAEKVVRTYIADNQKEFPNIEFFEKGIALDLGDGISVVGRIDLVRRKDTGVTTIVDLKSSERAQAEDVTEAQLHIYALGYQELTGRNADFVEIYELDNGKRSPRSVDDNFIEKVATDVRGAAIALRQGTLTAKPQAKRCGSCDFCNMCTSGRTSLDQGGA